LNLLIVWFPSVDPLRDLGLAKTSRLVSTPRDFQNANIFRNRIPALSASADVQTLVELRMKAIADARELFALVGLDPSAIDAFRTNSRAASASALASPVGAR